MKKQLLLPAAWMVFIVLVMSSCSKNMDLDLQHTDLKKPDFKQGQVDLRHAEHVQNGCRIRQTINRQSPYYTLTRHFEYNKDNNPVSVISNMAGTGQPNLFFTYDKKGNLTEYYGLYSGGNFFEFLHRYGYSNDKIVVDTMYIWGEYPNPKTYYSKRVRYLKYDELDRVISDSEVYVYPTQPTSVIKYNYDNDGNLIRYAANYDDKMSPQRTNKIWMFADRNYSVNNLTRADSYTSSGLPLTLSADPYIPLMTFAYFNYYHSVEIVYDCIEHGKKFHPNPKG